MTRSSPRPTRCTRLRKTRRSRNKLESIGKEAEVAGIRGQPIKQRGEKYKRIPLGNLAMLKSGELVKIELEIESKNDYEDVIFEDFEATGLSPSMCGVAVHATDSELTRNFVTTASRFSSANSREAATASRIASGPQFLAASAPYPREPMRCTLLS